VTQDLPPQEGLSLLDLFVMAVESWWLILLGAVLAAGATFFLTSDQPSTYYSRATLSAPAAWVETYLEGNPESEAATTDFAVTSDSANNAIVTVWSDTAETATTTLR
jgi:hypothetical protein